MRPRRSIVVPVNRSKTITKEPLVKPQTRVEPDVLTSIESSTLEDSFVYVHCYFNNASDEMLIRIWKSTFLVDYATGNRSALVHAENISMAPQWTIIPGHTTFRFLLIFNALPGGCKLFDLIEVIPQPGGFHIEKIPRNELDVYHVDLI